MKGVPDFGRLLGKSTLFNGGQESSGNDKDQDDPVDAREENGVLNSDDGSRIGTFVTSKGKVIKLRKKERGKMARIAQYQLLGSGDDNKTFWKGEESYGININVLIEKIKNECSKSDSETQHNDGKCLLKNSKSDSETQNNDGKIKDKCAKSDSETQNNDGKIKDKCSKSDSETQRSDGEIKDKRSKSDPEIQSNDGEIKHKRSKSDFETQHNDEKIKDKCGKSDSEAQNNDGKIKDKCSKSDSETQRNDGRIKHKRSKSDSEIQSNDGKIKNKRLKPDPETQRKDEKNKDKRSKSDAETQRKDEKIKNKRSKPDSKTQRKDGKCLLKNVDRLWVEKWSPKKFLDLVGNEKTNRRVLAWIRQWSPCVFNEQLPERSSGRPEQDVSDPLLRPAKRILLIHGPPGIGKTSVAHVAAKQAGYYVAEINASDERAGTLVRDRIHNTLFNNSFDNKPVCLIADEIDGSTESGFIRVLVDIINKDEQATQKHLLGSNITGKRRKKKAKLLLRPIIAICNNLYAPVLEKLKPHCEIIAVKRPSDSSLQERLEEICRAEGVKVSIEALKDLMHIAQGDVRNCVNSLQFLTTKKDFCANELNDNPLNSISKDFSQSWFRICNQLFRRDPDKELQYELREKMQLVEQSGSFEKILQGCHSLYPHVKYSDNGVEKPAIIADWLFYHDLMFKSLFEHNGELLRYSSVVPLAFFNLFGDVANRDDLRIENPEYELRETQKSNQDILKLMMHKISLATPSIVPFLSFESLVLDLLPNLDRMISADLTKCRDVKVKQTVYDNLIDILKCFQLELAERFHDNYGSKKILFIEPPITAIVLMDPQRQKEVITKRSALLDILLAKVEENNARKRHIKKVNEDRARNEEIKNNAIKARKSGTSMADFFKNQYKVEDRDRCDRSDKTALAGLNNDQNFRIWVKYKEGFSDAVRKNVSWHDLWS
ncbi:hypothetical protein HG537_0A04120 [Torulaspora globosa]|uniref:AAA+ ATPase domain-containing protein n=1 Tax=Torulaspora globosa TaxID=48254 RepID=A0A7H9HPB4_9SACH|nr:hypothetical protein HG537_0A04120 [Torulaspora sp. CBS 2947]